jgi:Flp pilus assembly protein TadG
MLIKMKALLKIFNINPVKRKKVNIISQCGATAVEFALVFPLLVMILFGIFQFGIAYNNWIALTHAAREGARLASVGEYTDQRVRDSAPSVNITTINTTGIGGNIGDPVTVTVRGDVLDIQIPFIGHWPVQLESTATMRLETSE